MNSKRILVVDDNLVNLKLASEMMECEGYQVDRALDAEAALAAITRNRPDLILMDLALPGMDGLELTRLLRAQKATLDIPVVALTAFAMKRDEERAMESVRSAGGSVLDLESLPPSLDDILRRATGANA